MPSQSRRWCFTLNNPSDEEKVHVADALSKSDTIKYGVCGRETGENGTPHLQGFVICVQPKRLSFLRRFLSGRAHFEIARGSSQQASDYCKKENDFDEYGSLPNQQGHRTDIDQFKMWVVEQAEVPSEREIARAFPGLWLRYPRLVELALHLRPQPVLQDGEYVQWQQDLADELESPPDDRSIVFYVDPDGGKGKSWFVRKFVSEHPDITQFLSIGKRDDLAYCIDETKTVFLFDIPRGGMEHFQYSVLEKLKDGLVFSPKYNSRVKVIDHKVHVVVFCNEQPNMDAMSMDRYILRDEFDTL